MARKQKRKKKRAEEVDDGPWRFFANALIIVVISIFLYDIFLYTEHWPFSSHRMYSTLIPGSYVRNELMLVTPEGEVAPDVNNYFKPIKKSSFTYMLRNVIRSRNRSMIEQVMKNMGEIYERNKQDFGEDWPELLGLKLYQLKWDMDPQLSTKDTPTKSLVFEYNYQ